MCVSGRLNIQPNQQEDHNWAYLLQDSALFDNLYCSDLRKKFFGIICNNTTLSPCLFNRNNKVKGQFSSGFRLYCWMNPLIGIIIRSFFVLLGHQQQYANNDVKWKEWKPFPTFPDRATTEVTDCPISILSLLSLRSKGKLVHRRVWLNNGPIPGWIDSFSLHKDKYAISSGASVYFQPKLSPFIFTSIREN